MLKPSFATKRSHPTPSVRARRFIVTRIDASTKDHNPPPRPQIRQLRSFDKVRPDSPPTPPASSPPILQAPPPHHARRQSETTSAGPLRRRLTSPASSTVETSTEHATAGPPSPNAERDKLRRVTPPERLLPSPPLTEESQSHPVPADRPPSSDGGSHQHQASITSSENGKDEIAKPEHISPPRGIWQWARAGTRLNMLGRIPHPPTMTLKAATTAVNGALEGGKAVTKDDFSVPSTVSTQPHNEERLEEAAAAKMEGLGIANSTVEQHSLFTQTKRSSDDLVASMNDTPSPQAREWTNGDDVEDVTANGVPIEPITPSPASRKAQTNGVMSENTPSPHRIAKYKIALASHILSPSRVIS
ncbi:uncharacterized protein N0V89_005317 [Didymosphaeria variabile]|uniref:Uncharacterized protein n=1 Tax=Didymosphaeria variabile TaxID=1932322 RepID=A0A9W9CB35_9PLEO|nr:uncharacterized protein N0V89_005317 [Didymosphaeria variabile]KAJ4353587.1 hypothetical protein N0V89_005317 [Didymosphaeria variabile]